jgi:hypothetical protein
MEEKRTDPDEYRRIEFFKKCGVPVGILIFVIAFPNVFWFQKMWAGGGFGWMMGCLVGARWQYLKSNGARPMLYAWSTEIGISFILSLIIFLHMIPDMFFQERELRRIHNISADTISSISVRMSERGNRRANISPSERNVRTSERAHIESFAKHLDQAKLFYPSHEGSKQEITLVLEMKSGDLEEYNGRIPEYHLQDISYEFRGFGTSREILLPGAQEWLEALLGEEDAVDGEE